MNSKTKSGLVGILSAGLLGVGCTVEGNKTTYGPAFFGAVAGVVGGNAKTPQGAVAGAVAKDALYLQAQMDNQRQAAEIGRSQININNNNSASRPNTEVVENQFFVCNYFQDLNGNGAAQYPKEFIGIKNTFNTKEKISFTARLHNCANKPFRFELRDGSNQIVTSREFPGSPLDGFFTDFEGEFKSGELLPGSYVGVWYVNGFYSGSSKIDVSKD